LFRLSVEYPDPSDEANIPDKWVEFTVQEFRKNLEHALILEGELGGYGLSGISPIIADDESEDSLHSLNDETGERCVSDDELRDVILHTDDEFRSQILWQAGRWSEDDREDIAAHWSEMLPRFIRNAWPRQRSAKSPRISARLCDLAFSNVERFEEMAKIILPLLTTIDRSHHMFRNFRKSEDDIVEQYPRQTLALLHAVLPRKAESWPYGVGETLEQISESDNSLRMDERWLELKRIWDSR